MLHLRMTAHTALASAAPRAARAAPRPRTMHRSARLSPAYSQPPTARLCSSGAATMGLNVRRGVLVWSFISVLGMNMASSEPMMWSVATISLFTLMITDFMFFKDAEFW